MLFLLVLTMISGARELMTPGAWKKDGITYTLDDGKKPASEPPAGPTESERRGSSLALRVALAYATVSTRGIIPPRMIQSFPWSLWKTPHTSGMRYIYLPNRTTRDPGRVLACEPELFGDGRLVLFTGGEVKQMTSTELAPLLTSEGKR